MPNWNPDTFWSPEMLQRLRVPVHYNPDSADTAPIESQDYDGVCGVIAFPRNKITTSKWALVTCKRCLNSKKRKHAETNR